MSISLSIISRREIQTPDFPLLDSSCRKVICLNGLYLDILSEYILGKNTSARESCAVTEESIITNSCLLNSTIRTTTECCLISPQRPFDYTTSLTHRLGQQLSNMTLPSTCLLYNFLFFRVWRNANILHASGKLLGASLTLFNKLSRLTRANNWAEEFLQLQLHAKQPTYGLPTSCSGWNCTLSRLSITWRGTNESWLNIHCSSFKTHVWLPNETYAVKFPFVTPKMSSAGGSLQEKTALWLRFSHALAL